MCRTAHAVLSVGICGIQMLVRVFMTTMLMLENVIRMVLQTLYNFLSFMLQLLSLIPICCVFLVTSRMKCFMCGGGGPCPVSRGGACDCLMSLFAIIILFLIFRATGVLDKIFYSIGYAKATTKIVRFIPTTGSITECSRNDTDTEYVFYPLDTTAPVLQYFYIDYDNSTATAGPKNRRMEGDEVALLTIPDTVLYEGVTNENEEYEAPTPTKKSTAITTKKLKRIGSESLTSKAPDWTTILYYLA